MVDIQNPWHHSHLLMAPVTVTSHFSHITPNSRRGIPTGDEISIPVTSPFPPSRDTEFDDVTICTAAMFFCRGSKCPVLCYLHQSCYWPALLLIRSCYWPAGRVIGQERYPSVVLFARPAIDVSCYWSDKIAISRMMWQCHVLLCRAASVVIQLCVSRADCFTVWCRPRLFVTWDVRVGSKLGQIGPEMG